MGLEQTLVDVVKQLWTTWQRRGLDVMLQMVPEDVEWVPLSAGGRVLRGSAEVREFFATMESAGEREEATPFRFEQRGECVQVAGSLRQFAEHGWSDSQPVWVYFFRDGRLRRAVGYRNRNEAEAAIAAHNAG